MNECFKRIILDYNDINKEPIDNIYYFPNEDNILFGYALIIGPENTPYQYGNYLFEFNFPEQYPYKPPTVKYLSNDGLTRFNPNFYRNGKVCLSILNTWEGEKWSACQSIRSILLTLQITMNNNPLLNEPGITLPCYKIKVHTYNEIIYYKNFEHTILYYLNDVSKIPLKNNEIINIMIEQFLKNKDNIISLIEEKNNINSSNYLVLNIYNLKVTLNYNNLLNQIKNLEIKKIE